MTQKRYTEIPKRQKCINKEEPYIGGAKDIIDDELNKPQSQVNQEEIANLAAEVQRAQQAEGVLDGKVATEKQRAEGVEGGLNTRLQTVEQLAEISVGGGDIGIGTAADFESEDPEDLAKVPTIGAMLGGTNDGVYDISARHSGATYADLSAAFGTNGANIPASLRRGGMSVRYVQSSDNKYIQYRLTAQSFTTDVSSWEEDIQIVKGGGTDGDEAISFVDKEGNCPMQVKDGHIKTKEFDSREAATKQDVEDSKITDNLDNNREKLSFVDEDGNCNLQIKNGHIITKKFDSSIVKSLGTKISDLKDFDGSAWNITNNKSATTTTLNSRLIHNVGSHEDSFNLSATIIPYGTSFEVAIGKYQFIGGTFFTLYYNDGTSKVRVYNIDSNGQYQLINIDWVCNSIQFASGKKIFVTISKFVTTDDNFTVSLCDEYGNTETFTVNRCVYGGVGSGWGNVFFELLSGGSVTVQNISFGYNIKNDLELIIIGHSYVEGNNLVQANSQDKDKKFAELITQDIGKEHCLTLGMGGDTISALISEGRIDQECKWFKNSKYALLDIGNNDVSDTVGTSSFDTAVAATEHNMLIVNNKLKKAGIIPVWLTVNWYALYGKPTNDTINSWMIETFDHVVDIRKCFEDGNGNIDPTKFNSDQVHPTVQTHRLIYNAIKAQAQFIFNF